MKRIGVVLGLTLSVAMCLCTLSVLIRPVFAESCTAKCKSGGSVTCYGHTCTAKDNEGCASHDSNKQLIIELSCSGEMEILRRKPGSSLHARFPQHCL
jgi:hypothetical protein